MSQPRRQRDYAHLAMSLRAQGSREATMAATVDVLWEALASTGVSWLGFYTKPANSDEMILGSRRDKPACSPISLEGMCGRSWRARQPIVLKDAKTLTSGYIACDPNDRGEVVIPLLERDGSCWGVLDLDSHDADVFDDHDVAELTRLMEQIGLSSPPAKRPSTIHL